MLNPDLHLAPDIFENPKKASSREGFGTGVVEAGEADARVVVLSADVSESTQAHLFAKRFPERFVQVGVAEQNLVTVASGMANAGKVAFVSAYAAFSPGRNWEQIKTTIALADLPVVVVGTHAGLLTGPDGATHQMLEDVALMRAIPNVIVISPCDAEEGRKATLAAAKLGKPAYLRFTREKTPILTTPETPFSIGKANVLSRSEKPAIAICTSGVVAHLALQAARELEAKGIGTIVANFHTIKPLDTELLAVLASECAGIVAIEDHQVAGGLGSAIAEHLAETHPLPMRFVGVRDRFGQSGAAAELYEEYGIDVPHIIDAVGSLASVQKGT